jgi:hypothetical protein
MKSRKRARDSLDFQQADRNEGEFREFENFGLTQNSKFLHTKHFRHAIIILLRLAWCGPPFGRPGSIPKDGKTGLTTGGEKSPPFFSGDD